MLPIVLAFLVGALLAAVMVYLWLNQRLSAAHAATNEAQVAKAQLEERTRQIPELQTQITERERELEHLREEFALVREARGKLESELTERERSFQEQRATIKDLEEKFKQVFDAMAADAVRKSREDFLSLAEEHLKGIATQHAEIVDKKSEAVSNMVKPIEEKLTKLEQVSQEMERHREGAYRGLTQTLEDMQKANRLLTDETQRLNRAFRNPSERGRWGELQLRRVIEMAGMVQHVDFIEQQEHEGLRPDAVIRFSDGRAVAIDSKLPMDAFHGWLDAETDDAKRIKLNEHARSVREHITKLSQRGYADKIQSDVGFVVMFLGADSVYAAAMQADSSLFEYGLKQQVLVATPVTLIGLLRGVAASWNAAKMQQNAREVQSLAKELYERFTKLGDHFGKVGKNLNQTVEAYNQLVSSAETRVVPTLRKFRDQAALPDAALIPDEIDRHTKALTSEEWQPALLTTEHLDTPL